MSRLIFIRHAETDMAGTFCGQCDPPINERGRAQIRELIARLGSEPFDAIYSSDLRRAVQTADSLAAAYTIPCTTRCGLREIGFGLWEGRTWSEIEADDPGYAQRWLDCFPALPAPNGESFARFERRVQDELHHLLSVAANKRLAVVTHGGVMRIALKRLLGYTDQQAWELTGLYGSFFVYEGQGVGCVPEDAQQELSQ